jgi:Acetamidase/Formamidase family
VCNRGAAVWSQVYLPVFVEGGKLSVGDMHFSQGDGEVSFCGAPPACNAAPHALNPGILIPEPSIRQPGRRGGVLLRSAA